LLSVVAWRKSLATQSVQRTIIAKAIQLNRGKTIYSLLLVFWTWPLWLSLTATAVVARRLEAPLFDMSGFLAHLIIGSGTCWIVYQFERKRTVSRK
jgi:hypothetical protein